MMTDDRIKNLERELNRLEKEYGDIGAYKEYGDVIRKTLRLLKEKERTQEKPKNKLIHLPHELPSLPTDYRISIRVHDYHGLFGMDRDVNDAEVEIKDEQSKCTYGHTDSFGFYDQMLKEGTYTVTARHNEEEGIKRITIKNKEIFIKIFLAPKR